MTSDDLRRRTVPVLALALASGVLSAIVFWHGRGSLWEDEVIAITHGLQPMPGFFVEMLRNDIHPFFYFLLVRLWAAPAWGSDSWVLASSLASALGSAAVLGWTATRLYGRLAGLWAVALWCALPAFTQAAGNLRMYGLLPALALGCWYANRAYLLHGGRGRAAALVVLQVVFGYSHAIGFFFLPFFALAALAQQWRPARQARGRLPAWLGLQAAAVLLVLPLLGSALMRGTEPLDAPGLESLVEYPAALLAHGAAIPFAKAWGACSFVLLAALGLRRAAGRPTVLVIPCGVLAVAVLVGVLLQKPMFKAPVFVASLLPFLALEAAGTLAQTRRAGLQMAMAAFVAALAALLWAWRPAAPEENYRPAAEHLLQQARQGDVVVVPNMSVYWALLRYAVSPQWGRPLDVMPLQDNPSWTRLKERLGPAWVERLGLRPRTDQIVSQGVRYVVGTASAITPDASGRVWVLYRHNYPEQVRTSVPMAVDRLQYFGGELVLSLMQPASAGQTDFRNPPRKP